LLNTLAGQPSPAAREAIVHHSSDGTFAIRKGPWKLAMKLGSHGFTEPKDVAPQPGGAEGQLYNLANDPGETTNRWLDEPKIVQQLSEMLSEYQTAGRSRTRD
jgi:arylsulfatase A-like enzyme